MFDSIEWQPERREKYIVNGALCDANGLPHAAHNRAFQYGDGFFETIRVCNGVPQHVELHWNRVEKSLEAHRIEKPANWDIHSWKTALESLCQANGVDAGGRLRVSFSGWPAAGTLRKPTHWNGLLKSSRWIAMRTP